MPKVSWVKNSDPPIDILMGVILERKKRLNLSDSDIANCLGVSIVTVNRLFRTSPWNWKVEYLKKITSQMHIPNDILTISHERYVQDLAKYI